MQELFSKIDGKSVIIQDYRIEHCQGALAICMKCICEDRDTYSVVFENASGIKLLDISFPFQIGGLEIVDCSSRGYQKDKHYFINDFEDGQLSFYCEHIQILGAER